MFLAGLIAALAMIFLLLKFNLKRIAKYDIFLDVVITFFVASRKKNSACSRPSASRTASLLGYK